MNTNQLCEDTAVPLLKWAGDVCDVPAGVQAAAKRQFVDTYGALVGGSSSPDARTVYEIVVAQGGRSDSLVPGLSADRLPARACGLVLGTMARALDLGPIHPQALHTAEFTLPALFAALGLRSETTGSEFLTAFIVGEEAAIRIGKAVNVIDAGVNPLTDGAHGLFGATIAVTRLLGLGFQDARHALGIASVMAPGLSNAMFHPPTSIIKVQHGLIAELAVSACLFAQAGLTGPTNSVLSGERGYLGLSCPWETREMAILDGLNTRWCLEETELKTFAACRRTHAAVDGLIKLAMNADVLADQVDEITIDLTEEDFAVVADPRKGKWQPQTVADRQFSLPFLAAVALVDREIGPDACIRYSAEQPEIKALMERVSVRIDTSLEPWTARTRLMTIAGKTLEENVSAPRGHPDNPFNDKDLLRRFKNHVALSPVSICESSVEDVFASCLDLQDQTNVENTVVQPLCRSEEKFSA